MVLSHNLWSLSMITIMIMMIILKMFFSVVLCIPVLPVGFFVFATSLVRLRHYCNCCLYHYYHQFCPHHYHHHKVCVIIVIIVVGFLGSIIYLRKVVYTIISIIIILLAIESTLWLWLFAMIIDYDRQDMIFIESTFHQHYMIICHDRQDMLAALCRSL